MMERDEKGYVESMAHQPDSRLLKSEVDHRDMGKGWYILSGNGSGIVNGCCTASSWIDFSKSITIEQRHNRSLRPGMWCLAATKCPGSDLDITVHCLDVFCEYHAQAVFATHARLGPVSFGLRYSCLLLYYFINDIVFHLYNSSIPLIRSSAPLHISNVVSYHALRHAEHFPSRLV